VFRPNVIDEAADCTGPTRLNNAEATSIPKAGHRFFAYFIPPCHHLHMLPRDQGPKYLQSLEEAEGQPVEAAAPQRTSAVPPAPPTPPAPVAEPAVATQKQLGRWTLLKPLARGGMGEVYLGTSGGIEGAERPCVIKIIRREHQKDSSFLARFFDEARIQAQLQHPGVAGVLEASTDAQGNPYVVLEYVEGRNLSELRQRASQLKMPLSWADAVAVAVSLAEALAHVHERTDATGRALAIVHRDMSPQNVMVGYSGDVKLIDFGTARGENRRCQTVSGVVFAKPGYVAPEVANQNQPGPQADLYALGIILWELIMGRRFLTGDPSEHLAKVATGERFPTPVSSTNNVPLELDTIISRLTAYELNDRTRTAREALTDLVRVLSRAPSLADGERSVRGRIAHLMSRLYPAEPMRSRAEFARLLVEQRTHVQPDPFLPESPKPDDPALLPGTRYKLLRQLGKSAMSVVHEAVHVDLERRVALKVLPKERCDNPQFEARFRREARALASLRHEGLVTLHDFGVSQDGRPFYAMELLDGQTLKQYADGRALPWREALHIVLGICSALKVAHGHGIIHRDIKPANVFLTQAGQVKLIDFGVAQAGNDDLAPEHAEPSGALRVVGTPEYMAPEQVGNEGVSVSADIYALGTLAYELVTGRLPYRAETTVMLLEQKRSEQPLPPRRVCPDAHLPARLDLVLMKALNSVPAVRYASVEQFEDALSRLLAAHTGPRRATLWLSIASAAIALGMGLGTHSLRGEVGEAALAPAAAAPQTSAVARLALAPQVGTAQAAQGELDAPRAAPEQSPPPELRAAPSENPSEDPSENQAAKAASEDSANPTLPPEDRAHLERAERLLAGSSSEQQQALELFRVLAEQRPRDPRVLEGWSKAAARNKWWGESLRSALRWASFDEGPRAQLHLARTQRLVGQRYGAIQTLERFLEDNPKHQEAASMLERYRGR
jgi:serine/threonine-protein kinase